MNRISKSILMLFFLTSIMACKKDNESIDDEKPKIDLTAENAFPKQCSQIKRGESFKFQMHLSDNVALGSYSIDVHHNFDHHSHSTEVEECTLDPVKKPIQPFTMVKSMDIPGEPKEYIALLQVDVPADVDPGNYHFMIQVTDLSGWSSQRGISIRITE